MRPRARLLSAAFADVRVPAADIDEAEPVLVAHHLRDARRLLREPVRIHGAAAGLHHFVGEFPRDLLAQRESFGNRLRQRRILVHAGKHRGLTRIERGLADTREGDVRNVAAALETQGQRGGERDRRGDTIERAGQAREKAGAMGVVVLGQAVLDVVLRLEVTA